MMPAREIVGVEIGEPPKFCWSSATEVFTSCLVKQVHPERTKE